MPNGGTNENSGTHALKAVLIDALYVNYPNENFTEALNQTLQEAGFEVDIYQGAVVTVDFLKKLSNGYKLIILRNHTANENKSTFWTDDPTQITILKTSFENLWQNSLIQKF